MGDELNIPLLVLDFIVILPITLLRLLLIYIYGSRYNVPNFEILDVMMHAKDPKFNNGDKNIDTNNQNISKVINDMMNNKQKSVLKNSKKSSIKTDKGLHLLETKQNEYIDTDTIYDLIKTVDKPYKSTSKPLIKRNIDHNLDELTKMISSMVEKKKIRRSKPKIEKIDIIRDSSSNKSKTTQISLLNVPELINTSSESDTDDVNESSFEMIFTEDN